ncbi:MAG: hypothetical protein ACLUSP_10595 [Christensenellales bacterium]
MRDAGIDNISSDLIIGLDGQDERDVENAVKLWQDLGITHASVYAVGGGRNADVSLGLSS